MSLQVILMGGPKSGTLHTITHAPHALEGNTLTFSKWPPLPLTAQDAEEQWPDLPLYQDVYEIVAVPSDTVIGAAAYKGRTS